MCSGIVGYWAASYVAILIAEHVIFRKMRFDAYNVADWDSPRLLTPGIAAMIAFIVSFAVIVPCMSQVWYVGPIAKMGTGDVGVFVGFAAAMGMYAILRPLEKWWIGERDEGVLCESDIGRAEKLVG